MSLPKLTGNLFRAGRVLAGLTRDDLANRAGLSRDVLRSWEVSSDSIVPAQYQMLCRAIEALESEGVRFDSTPRFWSNGHARIGDSPFSTNLGLEASKKPEWSLATPPVPTCRSKELSRAFDWLDVVNAAAIPMRAEPAATRCGEVVE